MRLSPALSLRAAMLITGMAAIAIALIAAHDSAIYRIEAEEACAELGGKMDWAARRCKGMTRKPVP